MSRRERWALLLILLLAFALRMWAIDAQGIWGDEAFSIYTAAQPLSYVLSGGTDVHPPLYHFLLHFWLELAGRSPLAVRYLSAWWALLLVAAGFALARLGMTALAVSSVAMVDTARTRSAAPAGALVAAFLLAISPFQIYYAQETRMYMQAAALCALSLLFFVRWSAARPGTLLLWFGVTLLALYTHYFAFFILGAQDLYWLIGLWQARCAHPALGPARQSSSVANRPAAGGGITPRALLAAHALLALLYLPWVAVQGGYLAGHTNARASTLSPEGIAGVIAQTLGALFAGTTVDGAAQVVFALLCLALAALGVVAALRTRFATLLVLCIVVPIAGAIAVNPLLPYFRERFLLIAAPAFVILMARGVEALAGAAPARLTLPVRLVSLAGLALLSAAVLGNYRFDPRYHKGEYDLAIAAIRADAQPGDAVLIYTPIQDALYDYYRLPGLSVYALPKVELDSVRAQHPRAWLLLYGDPASYDPTHSAERSLSALGFKSFYRSFRDGALVRYDFAAGPGAVGAARIGFGDAIQLTGLALPAAVARGSTVPLSLQWQAARPVALNYTVFIHLLGPDGKVAAQMDTQPAGGTRPTTTWQPGETIHDNVGIALPDGMATGKYRVELGMYDLASLRRLPVTDPDGRPVQDDAIVIGTVEVQ